MRHIIILLGVLSLVGCGNDDSEKPKMSETVKPSVKPDVQPDDVDPKDIALTFFNVDMYQNGTADIKYIGTNESNQSYERNIHILNQNSEYEDKISHKLNYKDVNNDIYSENYIVDVKNKLIIKVDGSVLYNDGEYKTFNYNGKYIQFDFNLKNGQESSKVFNVTIFDSSLRQIVTVPTKVTAKYLGLDQKEIGSITYNTGKFETIEETKNSKKVITTWFNITNGVIVKQTEIDNDSDNTEVDNTFHIVDSTVDFNANYNEITLAKFNLSFMNGERVSEQVSEDDINLYTGGDDSIVVNLVNNNIKVSGYHNSQFLDANSVVDKTIESHSDGVLSSFVSKIQYSRVECEVNCSGTMINTLYLLGVRNSFDSRNSYDSEYAGRYNWYRAKDSLISSDYFIVMDLKAKTCHVSSKNKLNIYECINLDINSNSGEIIASVIEKGTGTYGALFASINGKNNEYITGVIRSKGTNDESVDTFIISKR